MANDHIIGCPCRHHGVRFEFLLPERLVRNDGLHLPPSIGAVLHVVELFTFLHDVKRQHDGSHRHHGKRAAEFARSFRGTHFYLDDRDMDSLVVACAGHTFESAPSPPTVLTCWL